jgi:hypothetical protein
MKRLFLLLFIAPAFSYSQNVPIDSLTNKIVFSEVVKVDSVSKDELYTRAREWFAKTFKSAQDVLQMDDKESGKLIGKGSSKGVNHLQLSTNSFYLNYMISITIKDGRYRYEVTDFTAKDEPTQYRLNPSLLLLSELSLDPKSKNKKGEYRDFINDYLLAVETNSILLINDLKAAMSKTATGEKMKDNF